ncbi:MAG: phosphohistidine phosphatase [Chloroflexota bacterium]|nr:phosphohistidine phosphatase [Chloroflexota bacterium]
MRIYFLRHGEADWPAWQAPDGERPLTDRGIKELRIVAAGIADLKLEIGAILTSPLRRASQTAEIVAKALGMPTAIESALAPGFTPALLLALIEKHASRELLLVGHEPDFSAAIRALTGGDVKMAKAGFACVEIIYPQTTAGELIWLIPPKIFKTG